MKELILLPLLCVAVASNSYVRVFKDSFADLNNWNIIEQPGADTGNHEWEYYTKRPVNVQTQDLGNGQQALVLRAVLEEYNEYHYTSGKVISKTAYGPYGFFNIEAKVPKGNGIWPAIWLLPPNARSIYGTWAACGEIDIMETICDTSAGYSTLHFGGPWPNNSQYPYPPNNEWNIDWNVPHKFGVEWQPDFMQFWLDAEIVNGQVQGTPLVRVTSDRWFSQDTSEKKYSGNAPFNQPFSIILNLAICGDWPSSVPGCCENIPSQTEMVVYDVEIWEKQMSELQIDS